MLALLPHVKAGKNKTKQKALVKVVAQESRLCEGLTANRKIIKHFSSLTLYIIRIPI